jgi:hypothetical protein
MGHISLLKICPSSCSGCSQSAFAAPRSGIVLETFPERIWLTFTPAYLTAVWEGFWGRPHQLCGISINIVSVVVNRAHPLAI